MATDTKTPEKEKKQMLEPMQILSLTLRNWKWVALSLIICLGLAVLYVKSTTPIFKREASVIVKDESDGLSLGGMPDLGLGDLGLFSGNSNFENELVTFRSPDYMEEVVRHLGLETSYRMKQGLRKIPLYGATLPLTVTFIDLPENESASMKFKVMENGDIHVSRKMRVNGEKASMPEDLVVHFNQTFDTPAGPVVIRKTDNWGKAPERKRNVKVEDEDDDKTFYVDRMSMKIAVEVYSGEASFDKENDKGATVINITIKDSSPQRAQDILYGLIDVYNERWSGEKDKLAINTSKFIDDRLKVLAVELGDVDEAITDYKRKNLIVDPVASTKVTLEKGAQVDQRRIDDSNNLEITRYLKDFLQQEGNKYETLPVNLGVGNASLEKQIAEYNEMMLQRNSLASNSSENNPLVIKMDNNIKMVRTTILSALDNQIVALTKSLKQMERELGANDDRLAASPEQEEFLRAYGREQTVKEQLYIFLLQKREENEISRTFAGQNIKLIRKPGGPDKPYKPVPTIIYGLAFIIGLVAPVAFIYTREVTNTKLRSRKDIENIDVPVLGEIPLVRKKMGKESKTTGDNIVVGEGKRDLVNEAYRVIRTNLGLMNGGNQSGQVVMITSFLQNSGKTWFTANLGVTMALKGKKVLIVDCDLRRRSASSYIGSPRRGLTDYLNGTSDDVRKLMVCDTLHAGLCVLPVGSLPPNPTELLESPRFRELIESLRGDFDYVLLDCPPSEMMADAQIIDAVTDRTIMMLRVGNFDLSMIPTLQQYYNEKRYRSMSIVINGSTEVERQGYGYELEEENTSLLARLRKLLHL